MTPRQVPNDLGAEESLLGSFLLDPQEVFDNVATMININDFYQEKHRIIYRHLLDLKSKLQPVDLVTLTDSLRISEELERVGSVAYLIGLMGGEGTAFYALNYAQIVKHKSMLRDAIKLSSQLMQLAYDQSPIEDIVTVADKGILSLSKDNSRTEWLDAQQVAKNTKEKFDELMGTEGISGLPTGFKQLDEMTTGLHEGSLNILAARSSMGKTAMALSIAENVAFKQGKKVAIFSLEMPASQLGMRFVSSRSRIDLQRLQKPSLLGHYDFGKIDDVLADLSQKGIWIDESSSVTIQEIQSRARQLATRQDIDLVIV